MNEMDNQNRIEAGESQPVSIQRRGLSTGAALALGISGVIIAAIIVGGIIAVKGLNTVQNIDIATNDASGRVQAVITTNEGETISIDAPACVVNYSATEESQVVSEQSPALITGFEQKCDGYHYVTLDYLGPAEGNPESGNGSYFTNTNTRLRTFRVDSSSSVIVGATGAVLSWSEYQNSLEKIGERIFNQTAAYRHPEAASPVYIIQVESGKVVSLREVYLP